MEHTLYQKVADQIEASIRDGLFKSGDKIPSVRKASAQMNVSMATVLQAYRLLEDRGIIKAQPQKGYFVNSLFKPSKEAEKVSTPPPSSNAPQLLADILNAEQDTSMVQLGAAIPHSQFLPIRQLQRSVGRLMRLEPDICAAYSFTSGVDSLKRQIAIRMLDTGSQVAPDEILVTLGCQNSLTLCLQTLTTPGDTIAIESPTYHGIFQAAQILKLNIVEIPCDLKKGMQLNALADACSSHTIKMCIVSPDNQSPTGACMPLTSRKHLLNLAQKYDFHILENDVYGELSYKSPRQRSLKSMDTYERVIYCSSFSKSIAPGFRVGWLIGGKHQAAIMQMAQVQSFAVPSLTQVAIANFLENGSYDRHLRKTRQTYQSNLALFKETISTYFPNGTYTSEPQGGFLIWVVLPNKINALELYKTARENNIDILPGTILGSQNEYNHHIRLNYAQPWTSRTESALKKIARLCFKMLE